MKILVSAFTNRCLMNWLPLVEEIRVLGGTCEFILFPRRSDPDHLGLYRKEIQASTLVCAPVDAKFEFCEIPETECKEAVQRVAAAGRHDAVLMTTCHVGPELRLKEWVQAVSPHTKVIGLQHGFVQPWKYYETISDSYDYLGVFGSAFVDQLSPEFRNCVLTLSLPFLSTYDHASSKEGNSVLFALQKDMPEATVRTLATDIARLTGKQVVLRPHPEFATSYDALRPDFGFSAPSEPLIEALDRAASVVTSGSTLALAAMAMRKPTAVVRHLGGEAYEPFGIVADDATGEAVVRVLKRFDDSAFRLRIGSVLERYTGHQGKRSRQAYDVLCECLKLKTSPNRGCPSTIRQWLDHLISRVSTRRHSAMT